MAARLPKPHLKKSQLERKEITCMESRLLPVVAHLLKSHLKKVSLREKKSFAWELGYSLRVYRIKLVEP